MKEILNYINGKLQAAVGGNTLDVYDPSRGTVYATAPDSSAVDVDQAIDASANAFAEWSGYSIGKRSRIMLKIAELIELNQEKLAKAESLDNGKPEWLAAQGRYS